MTATIKYLSSQNRGTLEGERNGFISAREQEILYLIAYEYSSRRIAEKLYVSQETVKSHRKNMMEKLDVSNTAGLIRVAFELGLMEVVSKRHCI